MRPLWLSHHHADQADRCVRVGGLAVCRRCLVLYPIALVAAVAGALGARWPVSLDRTLLWLLPIPAVLDLLADALGHRHVPRRQVAATMLLAVAMGVAWLRTRTQPGDGLVWSVVGTYGVLAVAAIWSSASGPRAGVATVGGERAPTTLGSDDGVRGDRRAVRRGAVLGGR